MEKCRSSKNVANYAFSDFLPETPFCVYYFLQKIFLAFSFALVFGLLRVSVFFSLLCPFLYINKSANLWSALTIIRIKIISFIFAKPLTFWSIWFHILRKRWVQSHRAHTPKQNEKNTYLSYHAIKTIICFVFDESRPSLDACLNVYSWKPNGAIETRDTRKLIDEKRQLIIFSV